MRSSARPGPTTTTTRWATTAATPATTSSDATCARRSWTPATGGCLVESGLLRDPYTSRTIHFRRGETTSRSVQIDHVVALGDAWQKGAQRWSLETRTDLANDPLELLAVDGPTNESKSDGDAATWLPPNTAYRCSYVARQIAVKARYRLWVTRAEHDAMARTLAKCPGQKVPQEAKPATLTRTTEHTTHTKQTKGLLRRLRPKPRQPKPSAEDNMVTDPNATESETESPA